MSNIMNYASEVLYNVRSVLSAIQANDCKVTSKLLQRQYESLKGQWPADVVNVALGSIGIKQAYDGKLSEGQFASLVERAKNDNADLVPVIVQIRTERKKANV